MNCFRGSWKIIIILYVLFLLTSGCITQPPAKNVSKSLPSIYTAPIGGFEKTWGGVVEPNTVLETDYIFYTRNWGPGEVKYALTGSYINKQFVSDPQLFYIDPSTFTAEPGKIYKSHVFLNSSYIPDYKAPDFSHAAVIYPARLNINVSLEGNSPNFGDDEMMFYPGMLTSGPLQMNRLIIDNCSIEVKSGGTRTFNASYMVDSRGRFGEISFIPSDTPLKVSLTPSEYFAKHNLKFPLVVTITAYPSLVQGQYPLNITINGTTLNTMVDCGDTGASDIIGPNDVITQTIFPLNVTVV
jgi:hypothetical protein